MHCPISMRGPVCVAMLVAPVLAPAAAAQSLAGWSTAETKHFRVHVPPSPTIDPAAFGIRQENALQELRAFFDVTLPGRIDYYIWNSGPEAERELGRLPGFAQPAALKIHALPQQTADTN